MSLITMRFRSECLNRMTVANVILPMPRDPSVMYENIPVMYLLHGMGDDYSMWLRRTNAERYALQAGLAFVMPDGGLSCYENMVHGGRYADYILKELPERIRETFPVSGERANTFIGGCSMGGCGALKLAAAAPEKFAAVAALSAGHLEFRPDNIQNQRMLRRAFGDGLEAADRRIEADFAALAKSGLPMRIFHYWGDRDYLKETALETRDFIMGLNAPGIEYESRELAGRHDWELWDQCLKDLIPALMTEKPRYRMM